MKSIPGLLLSNLVAIRYFVPSSFCHGFSIPREALDRSLRVSIGYDHVVSTTNFFWDYVLEIFSVGYPINRIPNSMGDVCVILGMDSWS